MQIVYILGLIMDDDLSETRRLSSLNLGELLNLIEPGTKNLVRELEKKKKKL